ncbi:hypothetical protein [Streptomyces murinus]
MLVKRAVSGRQPADSLFECGVLGGDPLDGLLDPLDLQVPDLAGEFADAGSLGEDLGVSGLERVRGVQRAYWPGRLALTVVVSEQLGPALAGLGHGGGDRGFGIQVFVEECAGDVRAAGDGAGRVGEVGGAEGGGPHSMEAVLGFAQVQGEDAGEEAEAGQGLLQAVDGTGAGLEVAVKVIGGGVVGGTFGQLPPLLALTAPVEDVGT